MTRLIIDAMTGTILDADSCYVVYSDDLTDADLALMDGGNDGDISAIALRVGKRLNQIGLDTGWGDNKYRYTVSYSPLSVRDEADSLLDGGVYDDPEDAKYKKALEWARDTATQEELAEISEYAMGNDGVWDGFRENLIDAVMWSYNKKQ